MQCYFNAEISRICRNFRSNGWLIFKLNFLNLITYDLLLPYTVDVFMLNYNKYFVISTSEQTETYK